MFRKTLVFVLIMLNILSCREQEEEIISPILSIIDPTRGNTFHPLDTIRCSYECHNEFYDSVCVFLNDSLFLTNSAPEDRFHFIPDTTGNYEMVIRVFLNADLVDASDTLYIRVYDLINPKLNFEITRINGDRHYFIGEKLQISVESAYPEQNISRSGNLPSI